MSHEISITDDISTTTLKNAINTLGAKTVTKDASGNVNITGIISGNGSGLNNLDGSNITSGTIDSNLIPGLDGSKITSGTIDSNLIPGLDGSYTNNSIKSSVGLYYRYSDFTNGGECIIQGFTYGSEIRWNSYINSRGAYLGRIQCDNSEIFFHGQHRPIKLDTDYRIELRCPNLVIRNGSYALEIKGTSGGITFNDYNSTTTPKKLWGYISYTNSNVMNFTGQHITFFKDIKKYKGYIVCANGSYYYNQNTFRVNYINIIESLPNIRLSNKQKEKSVFGVISDEYQNFNLSPMKHPDNEKHNNFEAPINSLGEGAIWVCDINGNLENGDYITSSDIPGIGMKQDDDLLHNYTVAKITMNCDFNPQYVSIQRIKNDGSKLILDDNENIIYEYEYDEEGNKKYEYEYEIKYIRLNGEIIDKSTYDIELSSNLKVYKMAFVGCTYHCG